MNELTEELLDIVFSVLLLLTVSGVKRTEFLANEEGKVSIGASVI